MPLGRDYSPAVGSVEVSGYPCLPKVAQSPLRASIPFCPISNRSSGLLTG